MLKLKLDDKKSFGVVNCTLVMNKLVRTLNFNNGSFIRNSKDIRYYELVL